MSKAHETRLKDRLKAISKETGQSVNDLMMIVFLERFVSRVSRSRFSEHLIFKGGFCLAKQLGVDRATKDLDFLVTKIEASLNNVREMMTEVCKIDANDGITYADLNVTALDHAHMKYPGHRIEFQALLGQIRFPMQIDLGVGDAVVPEPLTVQLLKGAKGSIYEESIIQLSYPLETIFCEKYETAIRRASINSRFKDYFDLVSLIESGKVGGGKFKRAFQNTFECRGSDPTKRLKNVLNETAISRMHQQWTAYTNKLPKVLQVASSFENVVAMIDAFVDSEIKRK